MTIISRELNTLVANDGTDTSRQRRSQQSLRRKRSLSSMIRRHLNKVLRSRHLFRVSLWLLLITAFIYVSLMNDVLGPRYKVSYSIKSEPNTVSNNMLTVSDAGSLISSGLNSNSSDNGSKGSPIDDDDRQVVSQTPLTRAWSTVDLRSLSLLPIVANDIDGTVEVRAKRDLQFAGSPDMENSADRTSTYVVNEGGSLWRTGRRFIRDSVLLNELLGNLEQSGMDVRSVSVGLAFTVKDFGSEGMLVVVEDDGDIYESRIFKNQVRTSVIRGAGPRVIGTGT